LPSGGLQSESVALSSILTMTAPEFNKRYPGFKSWTRQHVAAKLGAAGADE
jgi:hypothetical protein